MRVGIALGSNLGDRMANLQTALNAIRTFAEPPVLLSRVYETDPVDCPANSPAFLNAAIEIGFSGTPHSLLEQLQSIEQSSGRPADRGHNAPRTLDLDILYFGNLVMNEPDLQIPHPRASKRSFVLAPLADIAPDLILPGTDQTTRELRENFEIIKKSEHSIQ